MNGMKYLTPILFLAACRDEKRTERRSFLLTIIRRRGVALTAPTKRGRKKGVIESRG